jgi:hypothetical protein
MTVAQLDDYRARLSDSTLMAPVDPGYARKLVRDLAQWSGSLGFKPHADFALAERLFGDVDPQTCEARFEFGRGGKPLYMPGPSESPHLVRRLMDRLIERLGVGEFDYFVPVEEAAE